MPVLAFLAVAFAVLAAGPAGGLSRDDLSLAGGRWAIETGGSRIEFSIANIAGDAIRGAFAGFSGEIDIDPAAIAGSAVTITIDPASVDAGEPRTTAFLKSNAVFDIAHERAITFRSTDVARTGPSTATIDGELVARGKAGREQFVATLVSVDGNRIAFRVDGVVPRGRYGMDVGLPIYSNDVRFDMILVGRRL